MTGNLYLLTPFTHFVHPTTHIALKIWSIEEAEKILSNYIQNYDNEDFYKYDALLWLNVRRNDYPRINDPNEIAYIVYEDLHDNDLPSDPSERVYCWVDEHIMAERKEFEQE